MMKLSVVRQKLINKNCNLVFSSLSFSPFYLLILSFHLCHYLFYFFVNLKTMHIPIVTAARIPIKDSLNSFVNSLA